jgi:hypothetical protein
MYGEFMKLVSAQEDRDIEFATYDIEFEVGTSLDGISSHEDYVLEINGKIIHRLGSKTEEVGHVRAFLVHVDRADRDGYDVFEIFDCHSGDLLSYYETFFDVEDGALRDEIAGDAAGDSSNVLIIDEVGLVPEHRGKRLGLCAISKLYQTFGGGVAAVLTALAPLQLVYDEGTEDAGEEYKRLKLDLLPDDRDKAISKLTKHLEDLTFEAWEEDPMYLYFGSLFHMPSPEEIVKLNGPRAIEEDED